MTTKTLNLSAAMDAGFTLEEILDASPEDTEAFFDLFPGPIAEITIAAEP